MGQCFISTHSENVRKPRFLGSIEIGLKNVKETNAGIQSRWNTRNRCKRISLVPNGSKAALDFYYNKLKAIVNIQLWKKEDLNSGVYLIARLACSCGNVPWALTCSRTNVFCVIMSSHANISYALTCFARLRAHVL